jgi:hypothetical protein
MITTKNITSGGGTSKVIQPGNTTCKINSITLDKVPYKEGAYNLNLHLETPGLGDDFEGFLIDKDNSDGPRYKGQIGKVRYSEWPFSDGETKSGIKVYRDVEILKAIQTICREAGCMVWFDAQDNLHETIESFVEQFDKDKPFKDFYMNLCIAGREYLNKAGYINYDLYLPRASKGQVNMQKAHAETNKVIPFDSETHIKKAKTESVTSFSAGSDDDLDVPTTSKVSADFNLDL